MRKTAQMVGFSCFVAVLASPAFWRLSLSNSESDILPHFSIATTLISEGQWYTYSLYYPTIYLFSLGGNWEFAQISSFLLLTVLTGIKAGTALHFARKWLSNERLAQIVALTYVFSMPIVNPFRPDNIYLGQFSANAWHNSTTIMASIFVLPAFWFGLRLIERVDSRSAIWFSVSLFGLVASKPNFALALGPALGLTALWLLVRERQGNGFRRVLLLLAAAVPSGLVLLFQYLVVYQGGTNLPNPDVAIAPFELWNTFTSNVPLSFVLSIAGPFVAIWALGISGLIRDKFLLLTSLVFAVAAAQYILLIEMTPTGEFAYEGNWTWAVIPAIALVFFRVAAITVGKLESRDVSPEAKIPWLLVGLVLALHVMSGIYYVLSVGVDGFRTFVL